MNAVFAFRCFLWRITAKLLFENTNNKTIEIVVELENGKTLPSVWG